MRLLFVHEVSYQKKPIFEMHEFPDSLAERGHEVAFLEFNEAQNWSQVSFRTHVTEATCRTQAKARLKLYSAPSFFPGTIGRLAYALWAFNHLKRILLEFKPDIVVLYAVPTSGWQAVKACRSLGIPIVYRALDVSHLIRKSAFRSLIRLAERFVYTNSDWVSANNPALAEYCISQGATPRQTSVELPPLLAEHFANTAMADLNKEYGIPEKSVIFLYMGSFFYFSGLPVMVEDFILTRRPNEFFLLIGGGEQQDELRRIVSHRCAEDFVLFLGFVEYHKLPPLLKAASVALNGMYPSLASDCALPNKVIQYLASGTRVVSTRLRGLEKTLPEITTFRMVSHPSDVIAAARELATLVQIDGAQGGTRTIAKLFDSNKTTSIFEERLLSIVMGQTK